MAKEYSTDSATAQQGGELGYFTADEMITEFSDAAFALEVGQYTKEPVETSYGYHVILCEDKKAAHHQTFDEVKDELTDQLTDQEVQSKYYEIMDQLKQDANIEYLSDDYNPDKLVEAAEAQMAEQNQGDSSTADGSSAESTDSATTNDGANSDSASNESSSSATATEEGSSLVDKAE